MGAGGRLSLGAGLGEGPIAWVRDCLVRVAVSGINGRSNAGGRATAVAKWLSARLSCRAGRRIHPGGGLLCRRWKIPGYSKLYSIV